GTPEYMSPEIVSGRDIGPTSDLYSLGCVAYEMLGGEPPFYHRVPSKIMVMQATKQPKPLIDIAKGIPPALSDIVMKLLEKDPGKRQQDAYIVMSQLDSVKVESEAARPTVPQGVDRKQKQVPTITSRPMGRSALWKTYVSGARTMAEKAEKQKVNMAILEEMEELCFEMEGIEKQQAALSATMEKIEGEKTDAISKLRRALDALAREISQKNKILAAATKEIGDLEFQVGEIRKRMESREFETSGEFNKVRGSLQKFESRRLEIKDRLARLSASPGMELMPTGIT
ncbi:MAG: protein kinase, partial [Pseudomonadota bacterium]